MLHGYKKQWHPLTCVALLALTSWLTLPSCGDIESVRRSPVVHPLQPTEDLTHRASSADQHVRSWNVQQEGPTTIQEEQLSEPLKGSEPPQEQRLATAHTSLSLVEQDIEQSACEDQRNHTVELGGEVFSMQHSTTEVFAMQHRYRTYSSFALWLGGFFKRATSPTFSTRVLIAGQWYVPRHHQLQSSLALKSFETLEEGSQLRWQPWAVIHQKPHPVTYQAQAANQERTLTYNARFDLAHYGACVASYVNDRGQAFSGGVPILLLPENSTTGLYKKQHTK